MRQSQQKNRMRGRGRKGPSPLSRTFESNGPDVKIRGTASHVAEKYASLARDALSSGDHVMAENYLQHAEHYNRIVAAAAAQSGRPEDGTGNYGRGPQPDFGNYSGQDDGDEDDGFEPRPERNDFHRGDQRGDYRGDQRGERNSRPDQGRSDQGRPDNSRAERSDQGRGEPRNEARGEPGRTQNRTEQGRGEQGRSEQQARTEQPRTEQPRTEQPRPEPARADPAEQAQPEVEQGAKPREAGESRPRSRRRPRQQQAAEGTNGANGSHEAESGNGGEKPARGRRGSISSDASMLPDSILGRGAEPDVAESGAED